MPPPGRAAITGLFRSGGVRMTPQRFAVMSFLVRHPEHATADRIYAAINAADPTASRATVYNSLRALVAAGMVREIALEGRAARFDANLGRHHHFVCDRCGTLEDVEWFDVAGLDRALAPRRVRRYELLLRGLCTTCGRAKNHQ
jgi:Fur family peroxide stress response transcriptional regulator